MPSWRTKDKKSVKASVLDAIEDLYAKGYKDPKVLEKQLQAQGVKSPGIEVIKSILKDAEEMYAGFAVSGVSVHL